jgi:hypothetical protein
MSKARPKEYEFTLTLDGVDLRRLSPSVPGAEAAI